VKTLEINAFTLAERFIGVEEIPGAESNPHVLAMLRLDQQWPKGDDVAWCSAFVNYICWLLRLPRSKSLAARSWLGVGRAVAIDDAEVGFDVVILQRGSGKQPGPAVLNAPGHVGFYAGHDEKFVQLLAGNQSDMVNVQSFDRSRILGVRRLV
jgi:uncharacterized protein (TIGR02594 family)